MVKIQCSPAGDQESALLDVPAARAVWLREDYAALIFLIIATLFLLGLYAVYREEQLQANAVADGGSKKLSMMLLGGCSAITCIDK